MEGTEMLTEQRESILTEILEADETRAHALLHYSNALPNLSECSDIHFYEEAVGQRWPNHNHREFAS